MFVSLFISTMVTLKACSLPVCPVTLQILRFWKYMYSMSMCNFFVTANALWRTEHTNFLTQQVAIHHFG